MRPSTPGNAISFSKSSGPASCPKDKTALESSRSNVISHTKNRISIFKGWAKQGLNDQKILSEGFHCFDGLYAEFKRS